MTTFNTTLTELRKSAVRRFDARTWVQDNITRSWPLTVWLLFLGLVTLSYVGGQLAEAPVTTVVVLALWIVGLVLVAVGELTHRHTDISRWLREKLLSNITNSVLTLLLTLGVLALIRGLWQWGVVDATFDSAVTTPELRSRTGANWGVVWGARKLLLTGRLDTVTHGWRVWLAVGLMAFLSAVSFAIFRPPLRERLPRLRRILTIVWALSPILLFIFLSGTPNVTLIHLIALEALILVFYAVLYLFKVVKYSWVSLAVWALAWPVLWVIFRLLAATGLFSPIDVDSWGGLLFTMIVSVFAIVASFPLGLLLALGRRSQVRGIPVWITWPIAIGATLYFLATSTPDLLETARNGVEQVLAFWPLLIFLAAYGFQRLFKGNVVSAASTIYIEVIRGVPLITVLFMAVIMAPFFFPAGSEPPSNVWAVMVAFALFTAAYLAENVRGGLQSIPKGQFEAADSIGLNGLQKMRFVILPQALRAVIPAIVGLFIGVFKDSSLVAIVGLFDLLGIINPIISNPQWLGLRRELYVFVAIIYFIGSFAMSSYSRRLEARLGVGER